MGDFTIDSTTDSRKTQKYVKLASLSAFSSLLCYAILFTITPASLNEIGRYYHVNAAQLSWLFRSSMTGFFLAVPIAGRYSDKRGKLPIILAGCLSMGCGLLAFAFSRNFSLAIVALFLAGIGGGISESMGTALIADIHSGPKRTAMMNASQAVFGIGALLAPVAAGALIRYHISWRFSYLGGAILCIVPFIFTLSALRMRVERPLSHKGEQASWRTVITNPMVIWLGIAMMCYVGAEGGPASWLAVYMKHDLNSNGPVAAYSLAIFWIGITLGRVLTAFVATRISDRNIIIWSSLLAIVAQASMMIIHTPASGLLTGFIAGVCLGSIWPTLASLAGASYPEQSGTVLGIVIAAGSLGAVIFPPTIGWLSTITGLRAAFVICIFLLLGCIEIVSRLRLNSTSTE